MKLKLSSLLPVIASVAIFAASCKKEKDPSPQITADTEVAAHYDDEAMVSEELDAVATDANTLFEADPVLSGNNSVLEEALCDATIVVDTASDPMTLTVTFNGANCGIKRNRTGVMVLSTAKGTEWKNAGATITVHFDNMKITRRSDGKSITLNGSKTYTNVSGGLIHQAASSGPIVHTLHSNDLTISFGDGTARSWNVARKKTFSYSNGLVITITGIHEEGNVSHIAEWGTNRFGNPFTTSITQPVVVKQDCDFRITAGEILHSTEVFTAKATFGLDASGNSTDCPGTGNYYYRLGWTRTSNGNSFNVLLPY